MKQRDLFAIAMVAIIVAVGAWILTGKFIANEANRTAEVELVQPYTTDYNQAAIDHLLQPGIVDFTRDPNLDAGGSDHTLTTGPEG